MGRGRWAPAAGRRTFLLAIAAAVVTLLAWSALRGRFPAALVQWVVPQARAETGRTGSVEGTVATDVGHPLPDAHLFLSRVGAQLTARTDSSGQFRFERVEAGRYVLRVFRLDYRDAERDVDVVGGRTVRADFRLRFRRD